MNRKYKPSLIVLIVICIIAVFVVLSRYRCGSAVDEFRELPDWMWVIVLADFGSTLVSLEGGTDDSVALRKNYQAGIEKYEYLIRRMRRLECAGVVYINYDLTGEEDAAILFVDHQQTYYVKFYLSDEVVREPYENQAEFPAWASQSKNIFLLDDE